MWRHAECNNRVRTTEFFELCSMVASMAVQNEKSISAFRTTDCMLLEVLEPLERNLIIRPAIVACRDFLVAW